MTEQFSSSATPAAQDSGLSGQHNLPSLQQMQLPTSIFASLVKLGDSNYLIWKGQVLAAIVAAGLEEFIFGQTATPPQFLDVERQLPNPDYRIWQRTDKSVMSLLFSSLTQESLSLVVGSLLPSRERWMGFNGIKRRLIQLQQQRNDFMLQVIEQHKRAENDGMSIDEGDEAKKNKTLIQVMMSLQEEDELGYTADEAIKSIMLGLLAGGTETTSGVMGDVTPVE
ncbi:hypothetical protein MLD38_034867 [Melastoma candidum]|uniref:Uncharacterized protein n=2 Tax=Melastoma candidum TaxID=119954 RepID=A0ACB9MEP0_9MYRT|nr:hypothetical protein MLD38_034866 [Melastoma candidum]KAI4321497.1 hypothetical protein MLD38_034867 [Melastoma candidum]